MRRTSFSFYTWLLVLLGILGLTSLAALPVALEQGDPVADHLSFFLLLTWIVLLISALLALRGVHRALVSVVAMVLIPEIVIRFLVLATHPDQFSFAPIVHLTPRSSNQALLFILSGTASLLVGFAMSMSLLSPQRVARLVHSSELRGERLFAVRRQLIVMSNVILWLYAAIVLVLKEGISGVPSGRMGFLLRFLPVDLLLYVNLFMYLLYKERLSKGDRSGIFIYVVSYVALATAQGRRGAFVYVILLWILFYVCVHRHHVPKFSLTRVSAIVLVLLIFALFFVQFATAIRITWENEGILTLDKLQYYYLREKAEGVSDPIIRFSSFATGFDRIAVVMQAPVPDVRDYVSMYDFILVVVGGFIPHYDPIIEGTAISQTKLFPFLYRPGMTPQMPHSESWGLLAQGYFYFGWGAVLIFFGCGFLTGFVFGKIVPRTDVGLFFVVWGFSLVYFVILSGVSEGLIVETLTWMVEFVGLLMVAYFLKGFLSSQQGMQMSTSLESFVKKME